MNHRRRTVAAASAGLLVAVLAGCADDSDAQSETSASTSPTTSPSDASATPSPSASTSASTSPVPGPGWPGALREDETSLPLLTDRVARADPDDADPGWIDIVAVGSSVRPSWLLQLRAAPPLATTLDPRRRVVEHGVVIDTNRDHRADCRLGLSTDAPEAGEFRAWVTNLRTGTTVEQLGPPYGYPFDFFHPAEAEDIELATAERHRLSMFFLGGTEARCPPGVRWSYYAYAVVLAQGREPRWDFAPDAGWLPMH